jgi:hypothetical protein
MSHRPYRNRMLSRKLVRTTFILGRERRHARR